MLLLAAMLGAGAMSVIQEINRKPTPPYQPKFLANTCFNLNGLREPWKHNGPDGIVVMRGYEHYLVMFREEAERRTGGTKNSVEMTFQEFDDNHYEVVCPKSWRSHR